MDPNLSGFDLSSLNSSFGHASSHTVRHHSFEMPVAHSSRVENPLVCSREATTDLTTCRVVSGHCTPPQLSKEENFFYYSDEMGTDKRKMSRGLLDPCAASVAKPDTFYFHTELQHEKKCDVLLDLSLGTRNCEARVAGEAPDTASVQSGSFIAHTCESGTDEKGPSVVGGVSSATAMSLPSNDDGEWGYAPNSLLTEGNWQTNDQPELPNTLVENSLVMQGSSDPQKVFACRFCNKSFFQLPGSGRAPKCA
eukprot:c28993_g1_i1 orf=1105-1860(-)